MVSLPSPPVKIAVTGLRGIPGVMGGVETHCEELLPRLAELDRALSITVLGRAPYLGANPKAVGAVQVVALPAPPWQSIEAIVSTALSIVWARWRGFRHVHIHAIGPGLVAPIARLLGMRVIVTHHGEDYERAKWGRVARTALRLGERASARNSHGLICVAPSLAERIAAKFPDARKKVRYIPNGAPAVAVPGQKERRRVLEKFGLEGGGFVLAVGRLVPEKGFDYLVEAHRRSGINQPLVIVGGADHASSFASSLLMQASERVRFLGVQPRELLASLYAETALFVLPSFHEGLPIVALEAARAGAPMLMSDIVPNRDVGLPATNYFPAGDVDALAQALASPFDRFAIDSSAISQRFDWDRIAAATLEVYRDVIGR